MGRVTLLYMQSVGFLEALGFLSFAQKNHHGTHATEQRVARPSVSFPGRDELPQPVVEDLLVDVDFFCHYVYRVIKEQRRREELGLLNHEKRMEAMEEDERETVRSK